MKARWSSKCRSCGHWIQPGEQIVRCTEGGVAHVSCDPDIIPAIIGDAIARPVCPRCWLERSADGSCGCEVPA